MKLIFVSVMLLLCIGSRVREANAQFMTLRVSTPYVSSDGSAVIVDPADSPLPDARVKRMTAGWKREIATMRVEEDGVVRFGRRTGRTLYLEITRAGFQIMHVKLKIARERVKRPRITVEIAK